MWRSGKKLSTFEFWIELAWLGAKCKGNTLLVVLIAGHQPPFQFNIKLIKSKTWLRKTCDKTFLCSLAEWAQNSNFFTPIGSWQVTLAISTLTVMDYLSVLLFCFLTFFGPCPPGPWPFDSDGPAWQKSRGGHPKERLKSVFTVGPTAGFSSSADQLLSLHSTVHIGAFWSRSCLMTIEINTFF